MTRCLNCGNYAFDFYRNSPCPHCGKSMNQRRYVCLLHPNIPLAFNPAWETYYCPECLRQEMTITAHKK